MRKLQLLTIPLVVFVGVTFSSQGAAFAKTTKKKVTSSTAAKKSGMSTSSVKSLQTKLKSLGYFNYRIDGIFGTNTKNAVKKFQKANGLKADGIVGSSTTSKINQKLAAKKSSPSSSSTVKSLQTKLKSLGYFNYKVDGIFGTNTKNAVKKFQRANGLKADGLAGSRTMSKINQKLGAKKSTAKKPPSRGSSGSIMQVINYAKRFLGVTYVYGGSSPSAFDCSGFTMYVFRTVGINLPHSAAAQSKVGTPVSRSNLSAGDLVFFETTGNGVSHVGIYLGNGYFIHASSGAGHVTTSSLSSAYYSARFRGGSRIID